MLDELNLQSSLGQGIWQQMQIARRWNPNHIISDIEYQRLKSIEENQVNVQEYENTIAELEDIIADKDHNFARFEENLNLQIDIKSEEVEGLNETIDLLKEEIQDLEFELDLARE